MRFKTPRKKLTTYPKDGLAKIDDAIDFLKVSRATIYRMMVAKEIDVVLVRGCKRIPWPSLHAYHG